MSDKSVIGTLHLISSDPFSFDWAINDYFKRSQKADSCFDSPLFTFGEAIWRLLLFPNDSDEDDSVYVAVQKVQSFEKVHDISFTIGVKDRHGNIFDYGEFFSHKMEDRRELGTIHVIERSTLQCRKMCLVPNNILTLSIEDFKNKQSMDLNCKPPDKVLAGVEILSENLKDLLLNEECCDITLKVKGIEIRAHKSVLIARSPAFASMLRHKMSETITSVVEIPDCTPDAFKVLLLYLYSGTVENLSADIIYDLYKAAVKYDLEHLKTECVQFMKDDISSDTFCDTFTISKKHKESELFELATNCFMEHVLEILLTMKWQLFLKEDPFTANELYTKAIQKKFLNSLTPKTRI